MRERIRHEPVELTETEFVIPKDGDFIPHEIVVPMIVSSPGNPGELVFPGIGQDGKIPRWIAEQVDGVDVASALQYWKVPPTRDSIRAVAEAHIRGAVEAWRDVHNDANLVPNMIPESQTGIGAAYFEANAPDDVDTMVYVRPLGFNVDGMGETPDERAIELLKRAGGTLLQPDQSVFVDWRNGYVASRLARRVGRHTITQLGIGLSEDMVPLLSQRIPARAEAGKDTALLIGEKDKMMTAPELREARRRIGEKAFDLISIEDASHRSLATRRGAADLRVAVNYIRSDRAA
jgi:pimeloyl-ACP methyl ester carboxylesterase